MNIARRAALQCTSTLVFKLEESPTEAVWRIHAAAAQVPLTTLLNGARFASPKEREQLCDGWELIRSLPIRILDQRNLVAIERISEQCVNAGGKLIIIDQLSMIECTAVNAGYERATEISGRLRLLARKLHVPIVLIVQVNREASKKATRLTCNDLRDSGCLENDAAAILLIDKTRDPDVGRWHHDPLTLEIIVGKNRYGWSHTREHQDPLTLTWWPWCCRIEDPPPVAREPE